jgi:O-antigen/teichoic acid export membrane protein
LVRAAKGAGHVGGHRSGEFHREMRRGARFAGIFAVGAPLALGLLGPPLLVLIYGVTYEPAADLLVWMVPIVLTRSIGVLIFPALIALDEQSHYARLMVATAMVNVAANLLLIPRFGAEGAILGTLAALLVLTLGGYLRIHRRKGFSLTF